MEVVVARSAPVPASPADRIDGTFIDDHMHAGGLLCPPSVTTTWKLADSSGAAEAESVVCTVFARQSFGSSDAYE